jgi:hypothetical protein
VSIYIRIKSNSCQLTAKASYGFADNLLTSVIRAWGINLINPERACIIVALAINSCI